MKFSIMINQVGGLFFFLINDRKKKSVPVRGIGLGKMFQKEKLIVPLRDENNAPCTYKNFYFA